MKMDERKCFQSGKVERSMQCLFNLVTALSVLVVGE
jgi:hypothetical protein